MQLISYGAQDIFLTGNAQVTFFKVTYRRYTNFSMEAIELPFIGDPGFGRRVNARITRNADLVHKMYIRVTIASIDPEGSKFAWVRRLGHAIIREVSVHLGGTRIDSQYGTWLDIWYELARNADHDRGYDRLIGDIEKLVDYNTDIKPEYVLYIPLQFWFNRYVGLSIPLIALQYHNMDVYVEFNDTEILGVRDCNFDMSKLEMIDATLLVDYIYLDTEERKRFAQVGHEYLIEQVQWNGTELVQNLTSRYSLDFNHPTKELVWAIKHGNYTTGKSFVYYTGSDNWLIEDASQNIIINSISIGNDPTDISGGEWFEISSDTFGTVGTLNIKNNSLNSVWINPTSLSIGDYGITDKITADITIDADNEISINNIVTGLSIRDISFPVDQMTDTRFNVCDPIVYLYNNYGLMIDGSVNPVQDALLQLNGYERFDRREGAYFNYVQPEQYHSNTPSDGINVFSFAIHPEEHQPSGTANLSRIDNTDLTLRFTDPTAGAELPELNILDVDSRIYIYGTNYNVLRVMAGLAGLAYTVG